MRIHIAGRTDIGRKRKNNEDSYYISECDKVVIVSDGMGGEQAGEVASEIVVKSLPLMFRKAIRRELTKEQTDRVMKDTLCELNDIVNTKGKAQAYTKGMGATVVAGMILGSVLTIAYLGDSRAYLLRNGRIRVLTRDHNVAALLLNSKIITDTEARKHNGRHMLTQYIGMNETPVVGSIQLDLAKGDRVLFCSDGLSGMVNDACIEEILMKKESADETCKALIDTANARGGKDNITVVVFDVGEIS